MFAACGGAADQPNAVTNRQTVNTTAAPPAPASQNSGNSPVVSSHSSSQTATSDVPADQPSSSSSMGKSVDVGEVTAKIEKAEKEYKAKPDDKTVKKNLADAYFERAFALTKAAQYRAALGDFRKGLKLEPDNKEARSMHDQIIDIFKSMNREPPKEGEEPPPAPFKKES